LVQDVADHPWRAALQSPPSPAALQSPAAAQPRRL